MGSVNMSTIARFCPYCRSTLAKTIALTSGSKSKKNKDQNKSDYVFTCFHCGLSITSLHKYPNNVDLYIAGRKILNWTNNLSDLKKPVYKYNRESYFLEKHRVEGYLSDNPTVCEKCKNKTREMHVYHNHSYFTGHRCILCGTVMFNVETFKENRDKIKVMNMASFTNTTNQNPTDKETVIEDKNAKYFMQLDVSKRNYISDCLASTTTKRFSINEKNFTNDDKLAEQLKFFMAKCLVKTNCNQIYSYFSLVRNGESYKFYLIDTDKFDSGLVDVSDKYPSINSLLAKELFTALANGKSAVTIEGKFVYDIVEYAIFKPYPYTHKIKKRRRVNVVEQVQEIHVYYRLKLPCISQQHPVESVTLITKDFKGNRTVEVNAYYCKKCKKYFINYEALQHLYDKHRYPVFHFVFADHPSDGFNLNKVSKLGSCGYSVRQGGMSDDERHKLLQLIIDNGILSKSEIICNIEFFIGYHGKQEKNKAAVKKWSDDIYFVSHYTNGNKRYIVSDNYRRK